MKIKYDKDANAVYMYLRYPLKDREVKKTVRLNENINIDYDSQKKMVEEAEVI